MLLPALSACVPAAPDRPAAAAAAVAAQGGDPGFHPAAGSPGHVGSRLCGSCHEQEYRAWQGSHHQRAMQEATAQTVLGDFRDARLEAGGSLTAFVRQGERFMVHTAGPDGPGTFAVRYTFGVDPLQQYLVELPGGRLQALGTAWDSRPAVQGGQRWRHLYPDQGAHPGQPLHWSSRQQNWNFMCADCHSTGVVKGYDAGQDAYRSGWAEISVGCEACHGPGQAHVAWARGGARPRGATGLAVLFHERRGASWQPDPESGTAVRSRPRDSRIEIDACGRCHGRASRLAGDNHGGSLLDSHRPVLLEPGQYWPDGQVLAEVFTWGPFLQSRMQAAGVTCSDCHEPHSQQLRAPGNALCAQCHLPAQFDRPQHHRHAEGSAGSRCVACHMPVTTFMQVDDRHDHAFRIPRPDLSLTLAVPNACNQCHTDRDAAWAAAVLAGGRDLHQEPAAGFAHALDLAARGGPGLRIALSGVIADAGQPAIVRASALRALAPWLDARTLPVAVQALADADPLPRLAAVGALARLPPALQAQHLAGMTADPVRAVRIEAAGILAGAAEARLDGDMQAHFQAALDELLAALDLDGDQPQARLRLGNLQRQRGFSAEAAGAYRQALVLAPDLVDAWVNLADLQRELAGEAQARATLQAGLQRLPEAAALHHALGLALVRQGEKASALRHLRRAAELAPEVAGYPHVLAVALHDGARLEEARDVLARALQRHPNDRALLTTLVTYLGQAGERVEARRHLAHLLALEPDDPAVQQLRHWLEGS